MSQNQRRLKNLLISPDSQVEYGTLFLAVSIIVHALVSVICFELYSAWRAEGLVFEGASIAAIVASLILVYLLLYGFAFMLGLVISHRLYGPLVSLERHLAKLKEGDYSGRITLRAKDDKKMKELAESLNALAARLEAQNRQRSL